MGDSGRSALSDSLGDHHLDPEMYEKLKKFLRNNGLTNTEKIFAAEAAELNLGGECSHSVLESTSNLTMPLRGTSFAPYAFLTIDVLNIRWCLFAEIRLR
uniref:LisH domain-containing protein n=1 Tax=Ditylenchus dipsaci TaxID=166011 RepID=A0A915E4Y4_9BILA